MPNKIKLKNILYLFTIDIRHINFYLTIDHGEDNRSCRSYSIYLSSGYKDFIDFIEKIPEKENEYCISEIIIKENEIGVIVK